MKKAIVYINQFFVGIGGEDKADYKPEVRSELVGPASALNSMLDTEVTHTIIRGDNYIGSNPEEATEEILEFLAGLDFDLSVAGPTFQAGCYGVACGRTCKAVKEKFGARIITSMRPRNPGVKMHRKDMVIFKGGKSAREMKGDVKAISNYANKYLNGEELGSAAEEGYFPRGIRNQYFNPEMKPAAQRGVEILIKKLNGEEFVTELPIPVKDVIESAEPIKDLKYVKIALMTTGGIVPVGNPDKIQSALATRWGKYDVAGMDRSKSDELRTIRTGFDPAVANADPNVIMPTDVLRDMEGKVYGELHEHFYSTVGTGTTQAEAERMSSEILKELQEASIDGVIMTSTWGTCTRCGAAMVNVTEKTSTPIVQIYNLVPVAQSVGVNKIVSTISIPYPLGDLATGKDIQWNLRHHRVEIALNVLTEKIEEPKVYTA